MLNAISHFKVVVTFARKGRRRDQEKTLLFLADNYDQARARSLRWIVRTFCDLALAEHYEAVSKVYLTQQRIAPIEVDGRCLSEFVVAVPLFWDRPRGLRVPHESHLDLATEGLLMEVANLRTPEPTGAPR